MVPTKPRVVIIGAGISGLVAANKLYNSTSSQQFFDLTIVEGGNRIGGRIQTSEFCNNLIEMGATWIQGIDGSPIHKIAKETNSFESEIPWQIIEGFSGVHPPLTISEGGFELDPSIVKPISILFNKLLDFAQGKLIQERDTNNSLDDVDYFKIGTKALEICTNKNGDLGGSISSIGSFLKHGLDCYWIEKNEPERYLKQKLIEESIFEMYKNNTRIVSSCGDLMKLDFNAEKEYCDLPGDFSTIAKGYSRITDNLASNLPKGLIQLGKKVVKIEWKPEESQIENLNEIRVLKLYLEDGSTMEADHIIITVSLGVLKNGIQENGSSLFDPPLPLFKREAISRLGFGVVNKLFLQVEEDQNDSKLKFPLLQMAFQKPNSIFREEEIPWWMRKTASMFPINKNSNVVLSWFVGEEALELESLKDEEIINGVSTTISNFLPPNSKPMKKIEDLKKLSNGYVNNLEMKRLEGFKFSKLVKSRWGTNPLFLGSYSYVEVGSRVDDFDLMAKPLPISMIDDDDDKTKITLSPPLQILFAGEATHRTHFSTTHGAYFSGLREADRLLQFYNL